MASRDASFTPGSLIRFGSLNFLATREGIELIPLLVLSAHPVTSGSAPGMVVSRRARTTRPPSAEWPLGMRNTATTYGHLLAWSMIVPPTNNEFVGVAGTTSDAGSNNGSHHPSRECFMADTHSEGSNDDGAEGRQCTPPSRAAAMTGALARALVRTR